MRDSNDKTVCSGLDNACYDTSKSIRLFVSYFNELTNKYDVLDIDAVLLDTSSIDMIISKSTIIKYDLFRTIPSQFFLPKPISEVPCTSACGIVRLCVLVLTMPVMTLLSLYDCSFHILMS